MYMKNKARFIFSLACIMGCLNAFASEKASIDSVKLEYAQAKSLYAKVVKVSDFGAIANDGKDDTKAINAALEKAKELSKSEPVCLLFENGSYDITPENNEFYALKLKDAKNILIDGNNATLIRHKGAVFFIKNSTNIAIANFKIKNSELAITGGMVVNAGEGFFDCKIAEQFPAYEKPVLAIIGYNQEHDCYNVKVADIYQLDSTVNAKKIADKTLRIFLNKGKKTPPLNSTVLLRYAVYGPQAVMSENCKNARFYNLTVLEHSGMGILALNTENIYVDNFNVKTSDKKYWMAATADGLHFKNCRGKVFIYNSYFEKLGDDALNIHQMYLTVSKRISPKKIEVFHARNLNETQKHPSKERPFPYYLVPDKGDTIVFGEKENYLRLGSPNKIVNAQILHDKGSAIFEFENDLPEHVDYGLTVANISQDPYTEIKNCTVRGNRARGFLIKVSEAVIENCTFIRPTISGILLENDASYWYEGIRVKNLLIKNCKFDNCGTMWNRNKLPPAIWDDAHFCKGVPKNGYVNETVKIENCEFINCNVLLQQTKNVVEKNNNYEED